MQCPICKNDVGAIENHHIVPQEYGGKNGPTIDICPTCHSAIHSQAVNLMGKAKRKWFFPPHVLDAAMPFVNAVIQARLRWEESNQVDSRKRIMFQVDNDVLRKLHLLKADRGFKSLDAFFEALAKKMVENI